MRKLGDRSDGRLLRKISHLQRIFPYMMPKRTDSLVYYSQQIPIENAQKYLKEKNRRIEGHKITLFHLFIAAAVRTLALRPRINRFVVGNRIFARYEYQISFIMKTALTDEGKEFTAKITFDPMDNLEQISKKISSYIDDVKTSQIKDDDALIKLIVKFPRFMIKSLIGLLKSLDYFGLMPKALMEMDPLYSSVFVANLGSIDLDAPFHHLYEWGTTSIFIVVGKAERIPHINPDGAITSKHIINTSFTIDERICDGVYFANSISLFKHFINHPEELESPPEKIIEDEM